jgi:ubiquinone/menaquinone biosynthesis C-methylase UbiE
MVIASGTHFGGFHDPGLVSALDELPFWSAPFGELLLETVQLKPALRVLDIGSGTGFPVLELAQRLGITSCLVALDPWAAATDRLKHKMTHFGISNVVVCNGTAEKIPYEEGSFDLITSNNGLNNTQDLRQAWRECSRVARGGAQMVVTENLPGTMMEFYQVLECTLRELKLEKFLPGITDHIYAKRKPIEEIRQLAGDCGFRTVEEKHRQFTLQYLDGTAFLHHSWIRLAFLPAWESLVPAEKQGEVFELLEERLSQLAKEKGELVLTVPIVCLDLRKAEN